MNAAIGLNLGMKHNDESTNNNGSNLIKIINQDPKWEIVNKANRVDNRTHVNRSSNSSRCLDYIITNKMSRHTRFYCDNRYKCTPYKVIDDNPQNLVENRIYSDHKTIVSSFKVNDKRAKDLKLETKIIKDEEGWNKWYELTHEITDKIIDQLNEGKDGTKIIKFIEKTLKQQPALADKKCPATMKTSTDELVSHAWDETHKMKTENEDLIKMMVISHLSKINLITLLTYLVFHL